MSATNKFKFNIPIAVTIVLVAFFLLFRTPIANLISSGDCLELGFFVATISSVIVDCIGSRLPHPSLVQCPSPFYIFPTLQPVLKKFPFDIFFGY